MRGILAGKALAYLEGMLKKKSGNQNATIANYFDMAIDVGVGGIFTAMLFSTKDHCCPIFSADDTWRFLAEKGNKFYRAGYDASNRGFLKRLLSSGCSGSVSSTTTGFEKAMKKVFTTENGGGSLTQGHSKIDSDFVLWLIEYDTVFVLTCECVGNGASTFNKGIQTQNFKNKEI